MSIKPVTFTPVHLMGPKQIADLFGDRKDSSIEIAVAFYVDARMRIIGVQELGRGTEHTVAIRPRDLVAGALFLDAAGVVLAHNHPSGNVSPSNEDYDITYKLSDLLKDLEIKLIDHLIIGGNSFYSMRENGAI